MLLAYTIDFERGSDVSLPLSANFVRVLDESGEDVRALPAVAGVSKEATSMALRFLTKTGHVIVEEKTVRLTPKGRDAREAASRHHAELELAWKQRFGADTVQRLRAGLDGVLDQRDGERAAPLAGTAAASQRLARDEGLRRRRRTR